MINTSRRKKYTFIIKNIDIEKVDRKYGIEIQSNLQINKNRLPILNIFNFEHIKSFFQR